MEALSTLGSSAKGMLFDGAGNKAVIFIPNPNYFDPDEPNADTGTRLNEAATEVEGLVNPNAKSKLGVGARMLNGLKEFGSESLDTIKGVWGGLDPDKVGEVYNQKKEFIKVTVQFNPASIRMDSLNGKIQNMSGSDDTSKMVQKKELLGRTKLSFDLVFDDVDLMDSFMLQEVADMNVTKLATKGWDMVRHKGNKFSVTKKMDTFMALLASSSTQQVIFFWGKMSFRGLVTGVTNHYTMFNTSGNPVRGTMHLEITQDASTADAYVYENKTWQKSYEKVFSSGSGGGVGKLSKLTNNAILNL